MYRAMNLTILHITAHFSIHTTDSMYSHWWSQLFKCSPN